MQIHELKRKTSLKAKRQVGRGGKRGKTSGRGTKGQKARAGHKIRPEIRDTIKKIPKLRGYRFQSIEVKPIPVNLYTLNRVFNDGDVVSPVSLVAKKVIEKKSGKIPAIKILGAGALAKKLTISGCQISGSVKEKVEKAGGVIK